MDQNTIKQLPAELCFYPFRLCLCFTFFFLFLSFLHISSCMMKTWSAVDRFRLQLRLQDSFQMVNSVKNRMLLRCRNRDGGTLHQGRSYSSLFAARLKAFSSCPLWAGTQRDLWCGRSLTSLRPHHVNESWNKDDFFFHTEKIQLNMIYSSKWKTVEIKLLNSHYSFVIHFLKFLYVSAINGLKLPTYYNLLPCNRASLYVFKAAVGKVTRSIPSAMQSPPPPLNCVIVPVHKGWGDVYRKMKQHADVHGQRPFPDFMTASANHFWYHMFYFSQEGEKSRKLLCCVCVFFLWSLIWVLFDLL